MFSAFDNRLVIATHNPGKLRELQVILAPMGLALSASGDLGVSEPEETGTTFIENALLKAHHTAKALNLPALADDSGLSVDALGGAPGIYSARWGGKAKDFRAAMQRVHDELNTKTVEPEGQTAHFVCALALVFPDGREHVFEGKIEGALTFPPRGDKGFGYDPIFIPAGYDVTFAEIDPTIKQGISHRANAFALLAEFLNHVPEPVL